MSNKLLISLGVLVLLLIGGVYVYFSYFRGTTVPPIYQFRTFPTNQELRTEPPPPEEQKPTEQGGGVLSVLVSEPTIAPTLSREGTGILYMLRENGNVYRISFDGQEKTRISNTTLIGVYDALWSRLKTKLFISYENKNEVKKLILDLSSETPASSLLPANINSATWSNDDKTFYYLERRPDDVRLIASSGTGQAGKEKIKIPLGDLNILNYGGPSLLFTEAPSGVAIGPLFQYNTGNGQFKELANGLGLTALASPSGEKVLLGRVDGAGNMRPLSVLTLKDLSEKILNVTTLPEKCVWSGEDVIFCGAPKFLPTHVLMPDEYYKGGIVFVDDLVKIDLKGGEVSKFNGIDSVDIQDVLVDKEGTNVFFRNNYTNFIHRFVLP